MRWRATSKSGTNCARKTAADDTIFASTELRLINNREKYSIESFLEMDGRWRCSALAGGLRVSLFHGGKPEGRLRDGALCLSAHASGHAESGQRCARRADCRAGWRQPFPHPRTNP